MFQCLFFQFHCSLSVLYVISFVRMFKAILKICLITCIKSHQRFIVKCPIYFFFNLKSNTKYKSQRCIIAYHILYCTIHSVYVANWKQVGFFFVFNNFCKWIQFKESHQCFIGNLAIFFFSKIQYKL